MDERIIQLPESIISPDRKPWFVVSIQSKVDEAKPVAVCFDMVLAGELGTRYENAGFISTILQISPVMDHKTHVTARQLRNVGIPIDEAIPDHARVPKDALKWEQVEAQMDAERPNYGPTHFVYHTTFEVPWEWDTKE